MSRAQVLGPPRKRREETRGGTAGGLAEPIWLAYAPVLILALMAVFDLGDLRGRAPDVDFLGFWTAAHLALTHGPRAVYDTAALIKAQGLGDRFFAFLYPPPFLAVVLPFGLLPYGLALAAWRTIGFAAYLLTARRLTPGAVWAIAAFPAALLCVALGQSSLLIGALFVGAAVIVDSRPFLAGVLLGAMICKPQLALLAPLALIAGGQTRALAGAVLSASCLTVASLAAFGWPTFAGYMASGPLGLIVLNDPDLWPKMIGLYPALRLLGFDVIAAGAGQLALTAVCAAVVWATWRGRGPLGAKMAVLAACDMLATPYAFTYDLVGLVAPICWLIGATGRGTGLTRWEKAALAAIYGLPLASPAFARATGANLAWVALGLFLGLLLRRASRSRIAPQPCIFESRPVSQAHGRFAHPPSASAYQPLGALGAAFRRGRARRG